MKKTLSSYLPCCQHFIVYPRRLCHPTDIAKLHGQSAGRSWGVVAIFIITAFLFSHTASAVPPGDWKCYSFDFKGKSFQGMGDTLRKAMADARRNCIDHTSVSRHCKTAQSYCEQVDPAYGSDRCVAVDGSGKAFNATGPDACDVAITLCNEWQYAHGSNQTRHCHVVHR